eukprot:6213643-Pleurochrysis_carterae.AAC.3
MLDVAVTAPVNAPLFAPFHMLSKDHGGGRNASVGRAREVAAGRGRRAMACVRASQRGRAKAC